MSQSTFASNTWKPHAPRSRYRPFAPISSAERSLVEIQQPLVDRLVGTPAQLHRQLDAPARELAVVEEAQARRQHRDHRGRRLDRMRKARGRARLVVVLQEARAAVLEVDLR